MSKQFSHPSTHARTRDAKPAHDPVAWSSPAAEVIFGRFERTRRNCVRLRADRRRRPTARYGVAPRASQACYCGHPAASVIDAIAAFGGTFSSAWATCPASQTHDGSASALECSGLLSRISIATRAQMFPDPPGKHDAHVAAIHVGSM